MSKRALPPKTKRSPRSATPSSINKLIASATAHQKAGRMQQAEKAYRKIVLHLPDYAEAYNNLGNILRERGALDESESCFKKALELAPDSAEIHFNYGNTLANMNRFEEAAQEQRHALTLKPDYPKAQVSLCEILNILGRISEAIELVETLIKRSPDLAECYTLMGYCLVNKGTFDEAERYYRKALSLNPESIFALFGLTYIKPVSLDDPIYKTLKRLSATPEALSIREQIDLSFSLWKILDRAKKHGPAFTHLVKAHKLLAKGRPNNEAEIGDFYQKIIDTFTPELMKRFRSSGHPSSAPIFILGMPRSGSTLVEQILASHPAVHGGGELFTLENAADCVLTADDVAIPYPAYMQVMEPENLAEMGEAYLESLPAQPKGTTRITDKMPGNIKYAGLIHLMFPNARIIYTSRDAIDTCFSIYSNYFATGYGFANDQRALARYYRTTEQLAHHWQSLLPPNAFYTLNHEALLDDFEKEAKQLLAFCGLAWDKRCLEFHKTERTVVTNSKVQVRQPLFRTSLQKWRPYAKRLKPLLQELGYPI